MRSALLACLGAATLAACARLPVESDGLSLDERRAFLDQLDGWQMGGRLAIDTGERGYRASFQWQQAHDQLRLTVRGTLGAGSFQIEGSQALLTVRSRGETVLLTDPETELSERFGWWLPVTSMHDWLMGLPDAGFAARARTDRAGNLTALSQRLWNVEYSEYQLSDGLLVPRRLTMSHGPLKLDLRVDTWSPEGALN